jgi:enoyl-CoA hydratase/carnithine racemase
MTIDVTIEEGVKTLRMNRPDKKNALTNEMYHTLTDEMISADGDDSIGAVLFLGAGGAFTSGNDVGDFMKQATSQAPVEEGERGVARFLRQQVEGKKPLIAGVEGLAIGVGATMLFQCDLVYAADNAMIKTPFLDLGVVAENASSYLAPLIMGHQKAFEMLCLGEGFTAEQAYHAGFVNRVCSVDEVETVARDAARRLAAKPPRAMEITRGLLRSDPETRLARMLEESEHFAAQLKSDEARNAFMAFMNRKAG